MNLRFTMRVEHLKDYLPKDFFVVKWKKTTALDIRVSIRFFAGYRMYIVLSDVRRK